MRLKRLGGGAYRVGPYVIQRFTEGWMVTSPWWAGPYPTLRAAAADPFAKKWGTP